MSTPIRFDDLEHALMCSSSDGPLECRAYLSRRTGELFLRTADGDFDAELPDDLDDAGLYVEVPHKRDLDLGRRLVFAFADDVAPALAPEVHAIFRHRGAYAQFKRLLDRHGLLDRWFAYESDATREALAAWAAENGFEVIGETRGPGATGATGATGEAGETGEVRRSGETPATGATGAPADLPGRPGFDPLAAYVAFWSEPDPRRRAALLDACWGDDAEIVGPTHAFRGRREVLAEAARFHAETPGARVVATSGFDRHGRWARFTIALVDARGGVVQEGWDIVEFQPDGKIARVVTFRGGLPAAGT